MSGRETPWKGLRPWTPGREARPQDLPQGPPPPWTPFPPLGNVKFDPVKVSYYPARARTQYNEGEYSRRFLTSTYWRATYKASAILLLRVRAHAQS